MRSALSSTFLVLAASWLVTSTSVASAQTMTITVTGHGARASTRLNLQTAPMNADECMNDSITLLLNSIMVTGTMQQLDLWRGPSGTVCSEQTARNVMTRSCTPISLGTTVSLTSVDVMKTLSPIPLSELIDCTMSGTYDVYFLIANGPTTLEPITNYGVLTITYDNTPPTAPTGVTGGSGDTSVTVSWTSTGESNLREQRVYGDPTGAGCGGGYFTTGSAIPMGATLLATVAGSAAGATVDLTALGLVVGEGADIVVVTVDQALNESLVGEIGCATRVETTGFCDAYGECQSCSVTAAGLGARSVAPFHAMMLGALAAVGLAHRRRRR